jgi:hypothetical protein
LLRLGFFGVLHCVQDDCQNQSDGKNKGNGKSKDNGKSKGNGKRQKQRQRQKQRRIVRLEICCREADFSTAAASAPPSVEMTFFWWGDRKMNFAIYRDVG